jgi:hypothetical protein
VSERKGRKKPLGKAVDEKQNAAGEHFVLQFDGGDGVVTAVARRCEQSAGGKGAKTSENEWEAHEYLYP